MEISLEKRGSNSFEYRPLSGKRTIRLLKFLPGHAPTCQMMSVDLDKAPRYVALSYTWGSASLEGTLLINGCSVPITQNLAAAIRAMYQYVGRSHMMFWADFVCINQSNIHERSHQVGLMNAIYRSADYIAIWLGETSGNTNVAIKKMREWKEGLDKFHTTYSNRHEAALRYIESFGHPFHGPPDSSQHRALEGFRDLCRRSWWERAWIVQEAAVAGSEKTLLFCGNTMVDWKCFNDSLFVNEPAYHGDGEERNYSDQTMPNRLRELRQTRTHGGYVRLLEMLQHIRPYQCKDPRDKVYASLGMAVDVKEDDIVPDYTKSVQAVYYDVVQFVMHSSKDHALDFLGHIVRPDSSILPSSVGMPSWIPDWRIGVPFTAFPKYLDPHDFFSEKAYNASGDLPGRLRIDGFRLHIRGFSIDTITNVWPERWRWDQDSFLANESSWVQSMPEIFSEAFRHALVADIGRPYFSDKLKRGFSVEWRLLMLDRAHLSAEDLRKRASMFGDISRAIVGRRLFQTKSGLVGLGPADAALDDSIWVFLGGQVLYVTRQKSGDEREFVGECYIHSLMDGEALRDAAFQDREIVLI